MPMSIKNINKTTGFFMKLASKRLLFWIVIVLHCVVTKAMEMPQAVRSPFKIALHAGLAMSQGLGMPITKISSGQSKIELNYTKFFEAVKAGSVNDVKEFITLGVEINKVDDWGATPTYWAARNGHIEIIQLLLQAKADLNKANCVKETPLSAAAFNNHKDMVQLLLEAQVDVDEADNNRKTPLYWAAGQGHREIVQLLLLANAKVDKADNQDHTPLYRAASWGHKDTVELLVVHNATINQETINAANKNGYTLIAAWLQNRINKVLL